MDESPRRRVLRTGGTLLAGGLTVGLGGCLQTDGTDTPTDDDGDDDTDGGSVPEYADWLPAPTELGTDHYEFTAVDPGVIVANESAVEGSAFASLTGTTAELDGMAMADLSGLYLVDSAMVLTGDIDAERFRSSLGSLGYSESETYQGYTFYTDGPGGTAAVSADTSIRVGTLPDDPTGKIETIIDAKRGAIDRYTDTSDDCNTLVTRLGTGALVGGRTHGEADYLDGVVADGVRWTLDGRSASFIGPYVFENRGAVDVDAVRSLVDETQFFDQFASPTISTQGRVALVDGATETGQTGSLAPQYGTSGTARPPQISFSWEYEARGDGVGVVTVGHHGGDTVMASELVFRGSGFVEASSIPDTDAGDLDVGAASSRWPAANTTTESGGNPAVAAGDRIQIGVASDFEIALVWEPEDGDTSATLSEQTGPDA